MRRKKPSRSAVYLARFVMFLVMFAVLFAAVAAVFYVNLGVTALLAGSGDKDGAQVYPPVTASVSDAPAQGISESDAVAEIISRFEFKAELDEYAEYISPPEKDAYITLINAKNPLDPSYIPDDLTDVADTRKDGRAVQKMRECASKALEAFLTEARAQGITDVTVTSGYRSYEFQHSLFEAKVEEYMKYGREEAVVRASTIVAVPGTSEHQSGLCADMHNLSSASVKFAESDSFKWLEQNCYKFGFILRYPADKIEITGISYEPWHYRFVGQYHATMMQELGMCLEEYTEYLR